MADPSVLDLAMVSLANVANLLMVALFIVRARGQPRVAKYYVGVPLLILGIPIGWIDVTNWLQGRPWWTFTLPLFLLAFLVLELILDYARRTEFRRTRIVGPYLGVYYVGFMLMIGYSFLADRTLGFVTLATYFAMLAATAYYFASGHVLERIPTGPGAPNTPPG